MNIQDNRAKLVLKNHCRSVLCDKLHILKHIFEIFSKSNTVEQILCFVILRKNIYIAVKLIKCKCVKN